MASAREQEAESPLKDDKQEQIVAKAVRLGLDKGIGYLKSLPKSTAQQALTLMQVRNSFILCK